MQKDFGGNYHDYVVETPERMADREDKALRVIPLFAAIDEVNDFIDMLNLTSAVERYNVSRNRPR